MLKENSSKSSMSKQIFSESPEKNKRAMINNTDNNTVNNNEMKKKILDLGNKI